MFRARVPQNATAVVSPIPIAPQPLRVGSTGSASIVPRSPPRSLTLNHAQPNSARPMTNSSGAAQVSSTRIESIPRTMIATLIPQKAMNARN